MTEGWDPETATLAGRARLSLGDTAGAIEAFAIVAMDDELRLSRSGAAPLPDWLGTHPTWITAKLRARERIRNITNAEARPFGLSDAVLVSDLVGELVHDERVEIAPKG